MRFVARFVSLVWVLAIIGETIELAQANPTKKPGGNLEALCKGKSTDFRNVADLRNLVFKLKTKDAEHCSENVIKAIQDLHSIADDTKACSVKKALAITQFYADHLRNTDNEEDYEKLLSPITRFALAYGMKVSHVCKKHLIGEFLAKADKSLSKQDFKELGEWVQEKGPIGRLLAAIKKPDEIILPADLSSALPPGERLMNKLRLKVLNSGKINRLKELCLKRFKPLYEQSIIPLAILSNSGIDYKQLSLFRELSFSRKVVPKVALWSRIVFLCESLETVEVEEAIPAPIDLEPELFQVVPDESTEEHEQQQQLGGENNAVLISNNEQSAGTVGSNSRPSLAFSEPQPIEPYFPQVEIDDEIMGQMDLRLKTIVLMYNKEKTEADRMKKKLLKLSVRLFVARFKYGELKPLIKLAAKRMKATLRRQGKLELLDNELNDLLDAKNETKLHKVIAGVARAGKELARWFVVKLMGVVVGVMVALSIITNIGETKADALREEIRKY